LSGFVFCLVEEESGCLILHLLKVCMGGCFLGSAFAAGCLLVVATCTVADIETSAVFCWLVGLGCSADFLTCWDKGTV
jgi:hypothetical protein